jgi:hypothetical protein
MMRKTVRYGILFLVLWTMVGCSTMSGNYGSIVPDKTAAANFEAFRIDPQMNYYYSGPDYFPNALIGLKKEYVLDNDLWKPLEPNPKIFKDKVRSMQEKARLYGGFQHGFVIRDPQGKQLGVWYSVLVVRIMTVKMGEGNKVIVYTPELDAYKDRGSLIGGDPGHSR